MKSMLEAVEIEVDFSLRNLMELQKGMAVERHL